MPGPALGQHYTIGQAAARLSISTRTLRRMLDKGFPGVVAIGHPGSGRRRPYLTFRISELALAALRDKLR